MANIRMTLREEMIETMPQAKENFLEKEISEEWLPEIMPPPDGFSLCRITAEYYA